MNKELLLQIRHIIKYYSAHCAINELSCDIYRGECLSILGPSGSGKSTLLQLIAGLIAPDSGEIVVNGKVVSSSQIVIPPEKRSVNMVFQNYALWPHMSVYHHIAFGLKRQKLPRSQHDLYIQNLIKLLELEGLESRLPAELSGGQQQRVAIARALSTAPEILLLDEPMSNLDMFLRLQMRGQLKQLFHQLGTTVILVTHDPEEALTMADRLMLMKDGEMVQLGTPQDCYIMPLNHWVAHLLGAINTLKGKIIFANDKLAIQLGSQKVYGICPDKAVQWLSGQQADMKCRPEDVVLYKDKPEIDEVNPVGVLQVRVRYCEYEGKHWRCRLLLADGQELLALHHECLEQGINVWVFMEIKNVYLYPSAL